MEGFDARRLKEILRVPDRYAVCACVATGYEYKDGNDDKPTPRLPLNQVVFGEAFGESWAFEDYSENETGNADDSLEKAE